MKRHYYLTDDLDLLEKVEAKLQDEGIDEAQLHVLSEEGARVEEHHLHAISDFLKKDVIRLGWKGFFIGFQTPNARFRRFRKVLDHGKHVFFVDVDKKEEEILNRAVTEFPRLHFIGNGEAVPGWFVKGQETARDIARTGP